MVPDTEQAQVDITAGKIELDLDASNVYVQSYGGDSHTLTADAEQKTDLGGTVKYSTDYKDDATEVIYSIHIEFVNAAPGDSVTFDIGGALNNTINVYYSEDYEVDIKGSGLADPFTVTGLNKASVLYPASSITNTDNVTSKTVTVKLKEDTNNDYQGLNMVVDLVFQAVQANAPVTDNVDASVTEGGNSITVYPSDAASATTMSAGISFTGGADPGEADTSQTLNVSAIETGSYELQGDGAVLAGISVTSSADGSALQGVPTVVTFIFAGNLEGKSLTIYHWSTVVYDDSTGSGTVTDYSKAYDANSDSTTVTFTTTLGFSDYVVTADVDASSGGNYYDSFAEAISAAQDGGEVVLLRDASLTSRVTFTKALTLDL